MRIASWNIGNLAPWLAEEHAPLWVTLRAVIPVAERPLHAGAIGGMAGVDSWRARDNAVPRVGFFLMDHPYIDLGLDALAQACDERAAELQARAWQSEAERNALREATAELLAAVARQLSARVDGTTDMPLDAAELRDIIANRVSHAPLHAPAAHAWHQAFAPGERDDHLR